MDVHVSSSVSAVNSGFCECHICRRRCTV
jgi:hypothetical protein